MGDKSLADQLQSVKLRKSNVPMKDFSSPKTGGFLTQEDISAYQRSVLDANTEEWFHLLVDYTFESDFVPLQKDEASLFVDIYQRLYANLDPVAISNISWREKLNAEELTKVRRMKERLQSVIDKFIQSDGDYVFVKLSSRSPKDAPLAQNRFETIYKQKLLKENKERRCQENTQIKCLLQACFDGLRMSNADEVLDACFRSERTYQDLLLALEVPGRFRENWVVRKFVPIDVDMEFRAFVSNRNMTAISQYNFLLFSEKLKENKEYYAKLIYEFYERELKGKLKEFLPDFIIDFAVCEEGSKIWVIEINPFLSTTDSALFSWEKERDILEGAQEELVIRITEKPRPGAKSMLPVGMKDLIHKCSQL